jgi:hypothetical protein
VIKKARPGCLVCPQNQGQFYGMASRAPLVDVTSQEALFTDAAHYGYHFFPTVIRYARGFGVPLYGCTVCLKDFWADFGGLKSPAQLHTEVAAYVSQGARCDIGDQVPPTADWSRRSTTSSDRRTGTSSGSSRGSSRRCR